jgi:hypothetical protein
VLLLAFYLFQITGVCYVHEDVHCMSVCSSTGALKDFRGMRLKLSGVSFSIEQLTETDKYKLFGFIFRSWKAARRYYC